MASPTALPQSDIVAGDGRLTDAAYGLPAPVPHSYCRALLHHLPARVQKSLLGQCAAAEVPEEAAAGAAAGAAAPSPITPASTAAQHAGAAPEADCAASVRSDNGTEVDTALLGALGQLFR